MYELTPEDRAKGKLATQAHAAAVKRLKTVHSADLAAFEREERVSRGLPAEKRPRWETAGELRARIAALEARLEGR